MSAGEELGLHLCQKLVTNDFGVTVGITPYSHKKELTGSESLVKDLRELYDRYPEKISFALQGLERLENELKKPLIISLVSTREYMKKTINSIALFR